MNLLVSVVAMGKAVRSGQSSATFSQDENWQRTVYNKDEKKV